MEAYELFDVRGKGSIDQTSLAKSLKVLGYHVDKKQVQEMISVSDENDKSSIVRKSSKSL